LFEFAGLHRIDSCIAAELRALEIEALNKQVAAMEEEKQQLEVKATEAVALANDLQALKQTVEKLQNPWWKKWFTSAQ
jgi:polyhydroxyalkanoate synthesis regulator phasin